MRSENIDNNQNAWIEPSHRTRVKKTPRLLKQDSNLNTKYFNIKDLAVEIDRNFPLIYNLEPRSSLEETSYKNLIESNNSDSKETVCSKNEKISNLIKSSSINSQIAASTRNLNRHDDYAKPKTIKGSKTVSSCYILQLYFIYLILCVVIMSFSFGYYYTIVSTRLKIDKLEKKMDEKISKKISVMMFEAKSYSEVKNKLDSNEEYNENYEMDDQELKNSKIKLYKMKQIGFKNKKPSNSEKNENFFVPKEIDSMENYFKEFKTTKIIQVNKATEITTKILGDRSSSISSLLQENVSNLTENNSNEFQQIIEVIKFTEPSVSSFETDHSKENNTTNVANTYSAMVNQTSNLIDHLKNNYKKERHRKRLEIESGNSTMQNRIFSKKTQINQCYLNLIDKKPTPLIFLGVFHCNLMIDIGSSNTNYYLTKGFKGFSVTMCQSLDELKSYRCYRHLSLEYSYYGTGHTIYKGYLFYNQEGTNELVIHRLDGKETKKVVISNDSLCCDQHLNMYNIKHSGYYDFEIDENGLWLIYRDNAENYVILKIDDNNFKELKILKRWTIKIKRENISNMFISCGKLYALGDTSKNPATIYKICDLFNDFECSNSYEKENFALSISSRQVTSLKYDSSQKILYSVDGGSLMYYKFQV